MRERLTNRPGTDDNGVIELRLDGQGFMTSDAVTNFEPSGSSWLRVSSRAGSRRHFIRSVSEVCYQPATSSGASKSFHTVCRVVNRLHFRNELTNRKIS